MRLWTDGPDAEVVALESDGLVSVQFHLESILSPDGVDLLADIAAQLTAAGPHRPQSLTKP